MVNQKTVNRGISTVIAIFLLIILAVATCVIIYAWRAQQFNGFILSGYPINVYVTREGVTKDDDQWPSSLYEKASSKGIRISAVETENNLKRYYQLRGWEIETGKPQAQTLMRLGLVT